MKHVFFWITRPQNSCTFFFWVRGSVGSVYHGLQGLSRSGFPGFAERESAHTLCICMRSPCTFLRASTHWSRNQNRRILEHCPKNCHRPIFLQAITNCGKSHRPLSHTCNHQLHTSCMHNTEQGTQSVSPFQWGTYHHQKPTKQRLMFSTFCNKKTEGCHG